MNDPRRRSADADIVGHSRVFFGSKLSEYSVTEADQRSKAIKGDE